MLTAGGVSRLRNPSEIIFSPPGMPKHGSGSLLSEENATVAPVIQLVYLERLVGSVANTATTFRAPSSGVRRHGGRAEVEAGIPSNLDQVFKQTILPDRFGIAGDPKRIAASKSL